MEDQQRSAPLTGRRVRFYFTGDGQSAGGMAALTGTLAGTRQGMISFTQQNEQEADRIGIQVLQRSGFDPQAMPTFLEKLLDQARYSSRPPEILLTHPLPESRLAMPATVLIRCARWWCSRRKISIWRKRAHWGCITGRNQLTSDLLDEWAKGNVRQQRAAQYGRALQAMEANKYDEARKTLQPLLAAEPGNAWYLDLATDIDLGQNKANEAINRLKNARDLRTNPVLQLNLANAYLQGGQPQEAANILNRYTFNNKDDSNGWDLLAQAEAALNNRDQELAARAKVMRSPDDSIRPFRC